MLSITVQKSAMVTTMKHPPSLSSTSDENVKLAKLVEMGFSLEASLEALRASGNDVEKASLVLTQQSSETTSSGAASKLTTKSGPSRWCVQL